MNLLILYMLGLITGLSVGYIIGSVRNKTKIAMNTITKHGPIVVAMPYGHEKGKKIKYWTTH